MISTSLFAVCLDESAPETSEERARSFMLDDNSNRWNDKSLSFIVCANGVSGFWGEHSMVDGSTFDQLSREISHSITSHEEEDISKTQDHSISVPCSEYPFITTPEITDHIVRTRAHYSAVIANVTFHRLDYKKLGSKYLRSIKWPAKPTFQMVIQLAAFRFYGTILPAWEIISLRPYLKGRLDIVQVVTPAVRAFCSAMDDKTTTDGERHTLLLKAIRAHANATTQASMGRGFDRHLAALRAVLRDGEHPPRLFDDPLYVNTRPRKIFTSSLGSGLEEGGSVWRDPDALWISYDVYDDL